VALGGVTCAMATNLTLAAVGAALAMAAVVILNPAFTSLIGHRREAAGEGTLMGINQSTASLGQLLGPLLGYAALGIGGGPAFGALLIVLGIGGALATIRLAT
jgi:MFS family permease